MHGSEPPSKKYRVMESIGLSSDEINNLLSEEEEYFQNVPNKCLERTDKSSVDFERRYRTLKPSSMPPIAPSSSHTVLIKLPVISGQVPEPYVSSNKDSWDNLHVRMPFSSRSLYPVDTAGGTILKPRWELVKEALSKKITTSRDLEHAILSYNTRYKQRWDFSGLHAFFEDELDPTESECFFENILPCMIRLALSLPDLIQCPIPLLQRRRPASISLSQKQIASLLANAFFCTFPRRNTAREPSEYSSFPDINFNRLYQSHKWKPKAHIGFEKLKCLIHYFRSVCMKDPDGVITFSRHYCPEPKLPKWSESTELMPSLQVLSNGRIEDEGSGMLQVDFANKFVGGGVLGSGCVQEEIQFLIFPELIVSRLFTEVLDKTEALLVLGCERFSVYKGYSENFEWAGDFSSSKSSHNGSQLARDKYGRRLTSIVAIDALNFSSPNYQYSQGALLRELNKAYVGFHSPEQISDLPAVATGNWGCGVFKGDARLKALLQLMASAKSKRNLMYFTFGNDKLKEELYQMHNFLYTNKVPIGELWQHLCQYYEHCYQNGTFTTNLYDYLYSVIEDPNTQKDSKHQNSGANANANENKMETSTGVGEKINDDVKETESSAVKSTGESNIEKDAEKSEVADRSPDMFKESEDFSMDGDNSIQNSLNTVGENG